MSYLSNLRSSLVCPFQGAERLTLSNGVIVTALHRNTPFFKCDITFRSGALADPTDKYGLAHFTEHIVASELDSYFSKNTKPAESIHLGSTSFTTTNYGVTAPYSTICDRLRALIKKVFSPPSDKNVERERKVILREFSESWPIACARTLAEVKSKGSGRNTPFAGICDSLGTPSSIKSITFDDVIGFHSRHYVGFNSVLTIVGPLDKVPLETILHSIMIESQRAGLPSEPISTTGWIRPRDGATRGSSVIFDTDIPNQDKSFGIISRIDFPTSYTFTKQTALANVIRTAFRGRAMQYLREKESWVYNIAARTSRPTYDFHLIDVGCTVPNHVKKEEFFRYLGHIHGHAQEDRGTFKKTLAKAAGKIVTQEWSVNDLVGSISYLACVDESIPSTIDEFDCILEIEFDEFRQAFKSICKNRFEYSFFGRKK